MRVERQEKDSGVNSDERVTKHDTMATLATQPIMQIYAKCQPGLKWSPERERGGPLIPEYDWVKGRPKW